MATDNHARACEQCGRRFQHAVRLPHPRTCGRIACRAAETWGPDEWAGQRRMARARQAAGRILVRSGLDADGHRTMAWSTDVLGELDRLALARES